MSVTLAIDAMGGDHGVVVTVPAACDFLEKHSDLKYIEMQTAEGLDKELDIGVQSAKGQYCWVFSDDDIIHGTDINNVVKFLEKRQNLDVLLVNSSIWNKELNHIILKIQVF